MSSLHFVSNILLFIIVFTSKTTKSSYVFRSQESPYSSNTDQRNAHQIQTQQSLSSKPVYDTLVSIDERIRLLEAYDNTYKLTRLDSTLDQLMQRIASIESKLSRLETVLDSKIAKVEDGIIGKELKDQFRSESVNRKIKDLNDTVINKATQIDTKFEAKIDQISTKLDSIERSIQLNNEEVLEKLIKYDERDVVFESHVKSHIINIENLMKHSLDASTNIKEMVNHNLGNFNKLVSTLTDCKLQQQLVVSQLTAIVDKLQNWTLMSDQSNKQNHRCEHERQESPENMRGATGESPKQVHYENNTNTNSRNIEETKEIINTNIYNNILSTLAQLQQLGVDERLTQLDVHVDYYSRKIINTLQEIWRSSQSSESHLREALDMANKTQSFIKQEFKQLQEQIALPNKTPYSSGTTESLENKLHQLSTAIDHSFTAVLIGQNEFINSCRLIQEEEEQLYDILEDMLHEIRNKSSIDISLITDTINTQIFMFNNSFNQLFNEIKLISDKIINDIEKKMFNWDKYSSPSSMSLDKSECFLTRSQLISVCDKNDNQITENTSNSNNGQTAEEKGQDKIEANYEELN